MYTATDISYGRFVVGPRLLSCRMPPLIFINWDGYEIDDTVLKVTTFHYLWLCSFLSSSNIIPNCSQLRGALVRPYNDRLTAAKLHNARNK